MFLDYFDILILKIIFKKLNKFYFDAFSSEKYFEKQPQLYSQTSHENTKIIIIFIIFYITTTKP
jgi:hypothetical protein